MICPICSNDIKDPQEIDEVCTLPDFCRGERFVRYKCCWCGIIFGPLDMLKMSQEDLKDMYLRHYSSKYEGRKNHIANSGLRGILDVVKPGQSCLSWGSGPGTVASKNAKKKYNVELWNYDPFEREDEYLLTDESKLGIYDGIVSHDVIEHLQDPVKEFLSMNRHLRLGGKMKHITSCYKYDVVFTKFHLYFFVGRSIKVLAERTGFIVNGDLFKKVKNK